MSYFIPFIHIYNTNAAAMQYYPIPQHSLLQNTYQTPSFPYPSSQFTERNNLILTSNIPTQDSLYGQPVVRAVTKKKKSSLKVKVLLSQKQKDQNFGWRIQNKDRNIMSNILKAFVSHLHDGMGMKKYIEQLFTKLDLQIDVSDFYAFFKRHFPITKSYISAKSVKTLLEDSSQNIEVLLILKLAINKFFRVIFPLILLKSAKIKRKSKLEQMKKGRQLLQSLFKE